MSIPSPPPLPNELWLEIFRWATLTPSALSFHSSTTYHPFQGIHFKALEISSSAVKRSLSQVCKLWNVLIEGMLYEDIIITPSWYLSSMKDHIRQMDEGLRRKIRRIYLPESRGMMTRPSKDAIADFADILKQCSPLLSAIIRPSYFLYDIFTLALEFQSEECPPLPNLERLDWWHRDDSSKTRGIKSLMDVLQAAPNLQYLSLKGQLWLSFPECPGAHLPRLTTLRFKRVSLDFMQHMCKWSIPSLRNVVLEMSMDITTLDVFWERFGGQLRIVELGRKVDFSPNCPAIRSILNGCPNLEELNYYTPSTNTPLPSDVPHKSLAVVGLQCCPKKWFHDERAPEEHLMVWCQSAQAYPKLQKILLYETSHIDLDCRAITEVVDLAQRRGCAVLRVN